MVDLILHRRDGTIAPNARAAFRSRSEVGYDSSATLNLFFYTTNPCTYHRLTLINFECFLLGRAADRKRCMSWVIGRFIVVRSVSAHLGSRGQSRGW